MDSTAHNVTVPLDGDGRMTVKLSPPPETVGLRIKAFLWRLLWPIRWPVSRFLWILSWLFRILQWICFGIHVAIDYVRLMYLDYTARPDDIFIVSYPRSGTTWLQMILYQLTTDGSMDFAHIAEKCPWFERSAISKRNLEKLPSPRVFKTHLPYIWLPKRRCRYIYVARNGKDVAWSFYQFYRSHFRYRGSFEQFFRLFMRGWVAWGSWFYHVRGYWKRRNDPRFLFLFYEDMVQDLEGAIRQIIQFCGLQIPEERIPEIVRRSSFEFMKQHEEKFDYAFELLVDQGIVPGRFLRKGQPGEGQQAFSPPLHEQFDRKYQRRLASVGFPLRTLPK
ncbi:MAG: sulfotransferase domain-containing protein [Thermoguttaceae bacterium]|nr:sulfotransferase domain-containing protein [Thermoguttaceae bacterium]MDW8037940.1 sulfotransferase domain-containing protein [Thermoguttaceae bacterium]